jgi:hypothetical protein
MRAGEQASVGNFNWAHRGREGGEKLLVDRRLRRWGAAAGRNGNKISVSLLTSSNYLKKG